MNSALHIGVLPPPDLKNLFSPCPSPSSPLCRLAQLLIIYIQKYAMHFQAPCKDAVAWGIFSLASSLGRSASAGL